MDERQAYAEQLAGTLTTMAKVSRAIARGDEDEALALLEADHGGEAPRLLQALLETSTRPHRDPAPATILTELHLQLDRAAALDEHVISLAEWEVLVAAAGGQSTGETANRRHTSVETVKSQRKSVLAKLGAKNMPHAVSIAHERGLLGHSGPLLSQGAPLDEQRARIVELGLICGACKKPLTIDRPSKFGRCSCGSVFWKIAAR